MARKVGLTLDQIVAAAAAVADGEGLEAVTLARAAGALGVRSPSLYSHVEGLAGLRRAMALAAAERLGREISGAIRGREGREALTELAHAYRRFARAHPGLYATLLPTPSQEQDEEVYRAFTAPVGAIGEVLSSFGVVEEDRISMIRGLRSALHGFVSLETAGGFGMPQDVDQSFATLVRVYIAGMEALRGSRTAQL